MESKEVDSETVKPLPINADEEVGEGGLENVELKSEQENENVEYSYESNRSPFPEGKHIFP